MTTIELHKNMKQAGLDEDCKQLLNAIDRLVREAELLKHQVEAGHIYNAGLLDSGRRVDMLAEKVRSDGEMIAMLEALQEDGSEA